MTHGLLTGLYEPVHGHVGRVDGDSKMQLLLAAQGRHSGSKATSFDWVGMKNRKQGDQDTSFKGLGIFKKKKAQDEPPPDEKDSDEPEPPKKKKEEDEAPEEKPKEGVTGGEGTCGGHEDKSPTIVIPADGSLLARLGLAPQYAPYPGYGGYPGYPGPGYGYPGYGPPPPMGPMPPYPGGYQPMSPYGVFGTGFIAGAKAASKSALYDSQDLTAAHNEKTGFIGVTPEALTDLLSKGQQWAEFFPQASAVQV
mmetsp:Transcript_46725/g.108972  ORF Transcript_46725/g.108972 Transcript_46725/m.108972 type:complete len:252 (+) Transcript_46725:92-847(+)